MRVHDSHAYRKMDVTRERISRILELREILLSIQIGFSLVNAAVACAILHADVCRCLPGYHSFRPANRSNSHLDLPTNAGTACWWSAGFVIKRL